jgi:hypothetical protein
MKPKILDIKELKERLQNLKVAEHEFWLKVFEGKINPFIKDKDGNFKQIRLYGITKEGNLIYDKFDD